MKKLFGKALSFGSNCSAKPHGAGWSLAVGDGRGPGDKGALAIAAGPILSKRPGSRPDSRKSLQLSDEDMTPSNPDVKRIRIKNGEKSIV
ncbi:MAG: hypothetical protein RIB55_06710 [Nitratireductor sp.]